MRIVFIFVFLCCGAMSHGQTGRERKNYLGVRTSFDECDFSEGGGVITGFSTNSHTGRNFYGLGLDYARRTSEKVDLCLGFTFINNRLTTATSWWGGGSSSSSTIGNNLFLFSFPVHVKYHLSPYLFVDGGVCMNIHPSYGYKWGVGGGIAAGGKYMFRSGLTIFVSPFMQWNILNPVPQDESSFEGSDTVSQKGVSIGLGYQF